MAWLSLVLLSSIMHDHQGACRHEAPSGLHLIGCRKCATSDADAVATAGEPLCPTASRRHRHPYTLLQQIGQ